MELIDELLANAPSVENGGAHSGSPIGDSGKVSTNLTIDEPSEPAVISSDVPGAMTGHSDHHAVDLTQTSVEHEGLHTQQPVGTGATPDAVAAAVTEEQAADGLSLTGAIGARGPGGVAAAQPLQLAGMSGLHVAVKILDNHSDFAFLPPPDGANGHRQREARMLDGPNRLSRIGSLESCINPFLRQAHHPAKAPDKKRPAVDECAVAAAGSHRGAAAARKYPAGVCTHIYNKMFEQRGELKWHDISLLSCFCVPSVRSVPIFCRRLLLPLTQCVINSTPGEEDEAGKPGR